MAKLVTVSMVLGSYATNCYLIVNTDTRETVIVDPAARADYIIKTCTEQKYTPVGVFLTHGHYDHIGALAGIREAYPEIKVYACEDEAAVLKNPLLNLSEMIAGMSLSVEADVLLKDGETLDILGSTAKLIQVPGHTQGGMCYYFEEEKLLFSGDTLFKYSIGRSDFPTGDGYALEENIAKKLLTLPEDVLVYPGHNDRTTIGKEKKMNPFFA